MIVKYPYRFVKFSRNYGGNVIFITLWFHPNTKRIVKQQTPFSIMCGKCGVRTDHKFIHLDFHDITTTLLASGWKEVERGLDE